MNSWTQMLVDLPLPVSILLKITLVLGVGWMLHLVLVRCNPRWRVLLWRAVVAGVVLVPVLVPLKYLQVPVTPPPEPTEQIVIPQPRTHFASEHSMVETSNASPAEPIPILEPPSESIYQPSFSLSVWTREYIGDSFVRLGICHSDFDVTFTGRIRWNQEKDRLFIAGAGTSQGIIASSYGGP